MCVTVSVKKNLGRACSVRRCVSSAEMLVLKNAGFLFHDRCNFASKVYESIEAPTLYSPIFLIS